ncbi:hypothetical protein ACFL9T_06980 [Thermodesulfobacteriota bacterium]
MHETTDWIDKTKGIILTSILFLSIPFPLFAQDAQFLWNTRFSFSQEYDDNIVLSSENPIDDHITRLRQSFDLGFLTEETEAHINFYLGYEFYQERSELNAINISLDLSGFKDIRVAENILLDLDQSFYISQDPIEPNATVVAVRDNRNLYARNNTRINLIYQFGEEERLFWGLGNQFLQNEDRDVEDSTDFETFAGLSYRLGLRNGLDLSGSYNRARFSLLSPNYQTLQYRAAYLYQLTVDSRANLTYADTDRDSDLDSADYEIKSLSLGLSHRFSETMAGSASFGLSYQTVDVESPDWNPSWSVSINKDYEKWTFSADVGEWRSDPAPGTSPRGFNGGFSLNRQFEFSEFSVGARSGFREQYFEAENLGFSDFTSFNANYSLDLTEDFTSTFSASYRKDDYVQLIIPREDQNWRIGASFSYQILEKLIASLNFNHGERESTIETDNFKVNRAFLTFSIPYEGRPIDF